MFNFLLEFLQLLTDIEYAIIRCQWWWFYDSGFIVINVNMIVIVISRNEWGVVSDRRRDWRWWLLYGTNIVVFDTFIDYFVAVTIITIIINIFIIAQQWRR